MSNQATKPCDINALVRTLDDLHKADCGNDTAAFFQAANDVVADVAETWIEWGQELDWGFIVLGGKGHEWQIDWSGRDFDAMPYWQPETAGELVDKLNALRPRNGSDSDPAGTLIRAAANYAEYLTGGRWRVRFGDDITVISLTDSEWAEAL